MKIIIISIAIVLTLILIFSAVYFVYELYERWDEIWFQYKTNQKKRKQIKVQKRTIARILSEKMTAIKT